MGAYWGVSVGKDMLDAIHSSVALFFNFGSQEKIDVFFLHQSLFEIKNTWRTTEYQRSLLKQISTTPKSLFTNTADFDWNHADFKDSWRKAWEEKHCHLKNIRLDAQKIFNYVIFPENNYIF